MKTRPFGRTGLKVSEIGYGMYEEGRFHDARVIYDVIDVILSQPVTAEFVTVISS